MTSRPADHLDPPLVPVPHRIVATWPVGTFIENVAVLADGDFCLAVHNKRQLLRVKRDGSSRVWMETPASPAGFVAFGRGVVFVAGEPGAGPHHVYELTGAGELHRRLEVPDTLFLNGFTPAGRSLAYTVDSIRGTIIEIDTDRWASRVVLTDERLGKCSDEPMLPGANGVKATEGGLYVTNTDRALALRVGLSESGTVTDVTVLADALRGDDLALDATGDLFVTNHIHNTLIRVSADGTSRVAIAGPEQGMAGSTACAFHPDDPGALYVTTTGGVIMPLNGVPQDAKLVRLEVGTIGRPLPSLN